MTWMQEQFGLEFLDVSEEDLEFPIVLNGKITGLGLVPTDPSTGNFSNNLPLPGAQLAVYATQPSTGERLGEAVHNKTVGADGQWGPFTAQAGVPYEFVVSAPGYATTHIYRSPFPRSTGVLHLREGGRQKKMYFLEGRPDFIASTDRNEARSSFSNFAIKPDLETVSAPGGADVDYVELPVQVSRTAGAWTGLVGLEGVVEPPHVAADVDGAPGHGHAVRRVDEHEAYVDPPWTLAEGAAYAERIVNGVVAFENAPAAAVSPMTRPVRTLRPDGKPAASMTNRFLTSCDCWNWFSTDCFGSRPMRAEPISWMP